MQEESFDFVDEQALRKVERIERALTRADGAIRGAYASLANALEYQLEIPERDTATVRLLARALKTFAQSRGIDLSSARVTGPLESLVNYES